MNETEIMAQVLSKKMQSFLLGYVADCMHKILLVFLFLIAKIMCISNQGCELDQFLTESKFERYLPVRVQVRVRQK